MLLGGSVVEPRSSLFPARLRVWPFAGRRKQKQEEQDRIGEKSTIVTTLLTGSSYAVSS